MNPSALMAKLHAGTDLPTLDLRGSYALLDALERPYSPQELDDLLPAAAVWAIFAGKELKLNDVGYVQYNDDGGRRRLPWSVGPLWEGHKGFLAGEIWRFEG